VDPRRIDPATRITLALLSRLFNWRDALVVVQPKTLIRWHRAGFRLLWHWKSKPGRSPIPAEQRRLIRATWTFAPAEFHSSGRWIRVSKGLCLDLDTSRIGAILVSFSQTWCGKPASRRCSDRLVLGGMSHIDRITIEPAKCGGGVLVSAVTGCG
jgi:hypothetical protein